jgi:Putative transposase DNA-binding domain
MFGRKSRGFVQMYEYGCRNEPVAGLEAALDQMERRVQLWNRFVEIEQEIRRRAQLLLSDETEQREIDELRTKIATLRTSILDLRKMDQRNVAAIEDLSEQVSSRRAALAKLMVMVRLNRKERLIRSKGPLEALQRERAEQVKQAQRDSKLYWCNYDDVRQSYEVARVRVMREGTELRQHHWNGSGRVSVRFQRGLPVRTVFTSRGLRLRIDPVCEEAWTSPVRSTRRRFSRSKVRIRVGSTPVDQLPVWFEIPVVIHRPLPPDGTIRSAALVRERLALSWRYRLILTVARPDPPLCESPERPAIGIDLGWRLTPKGLRVAFWADTLGSNGDLVIPPSDMAEFAKIGQLRSVLDSHFTQIRGAILDWRVANAIPEVLLPYFERVSDHQSPRSLLRLIDAWQKDRAERDDEILAQALEWKRRHIHLWTWAVNLRDQLTGKRLDLFRRFAATLVKAYGTIFLERFDLRWFSRIAPAEIPRTSIGGKYRVTAAPGILRQVLENACRRTGVRLVRVEARNTTKACHACGRIEEWNPAKQLVHKCSCGAVWDQDYNAALQILRSGLRERGTAEYQLTASGTNAVTQGLNTRPSSRGKT